MEPENTHRHHHGPEHQRQLQGLSVRVQKIPFGTQRGAKQKMHVRRKENQPFPSGIGGKIGGAQINGKRAQHAAEIFRRAEASLPDPALQHHNQPGKISDDENGIDQRSRLFDQLPDPVDPHFPIEKQICVHRLFLRLSSGTEQFLSGGRTFFLFFPGE